MAPAGPPLPIDELLPDIAAKLSARGAVVVSAETGAGKTTRVPPALLDSGLAHGRKVVLVEPRRIAARAAARRIAFERGVRLGEEVGYQVRFDRCAGPRTQLLAVTEGILVRALQDDPFLSDVGVLIFDEFHERSLDADLAFALADRVRRDARPDLSVVVMSATLETDAIAGFLGQGSDAGAAPVVRAPGRLFPVDVEWEPMTRDDRLEAVVAHVVSATAARTPGDILVFLPGIGEIRRCSDALAGFAAARDVELVALHGDLPPEQQDAALAPASDERDGAPARRRVVLATNVAETSVTLPRVTAVIDSGLVRRMQFDPASGLDRLELGRVSKASAEQRRGRAGRVAPGLCVRLWSQLDHRGLADAETPEIRRVDLAGLALQLLAFGERDLSRFRFLEAPEPARLAQALELLQRLGAARMATSAELPELTARGKAMAELPLHPRLARLLLEGKERGVAPRAAIAAALLSERDPFVARPRSAQHVSESDVVDRVAALEEFARAGVTSFECGELHRGRAQWILRGAEPFARLARAPASERPGSEAAADAALQRALFAAFSDRLVRRREPGSPRGVMAGGRGVRLADESAVRRSELFVAVDVDGGAGGRGSDDALVRRASAVERDWLDPELLVTEEVVRFDAAREAVAGLRVTRWRDLVVDERGGVAPDPELAARALAAAAAEQVGRALALDREEIAGFRARANRLREWMPELGLPRLDDDWFKARLEELCAGARSFAELQKLPLVELVRASLGHALASAIDQHAPERLAVPSGSAIRLDYPPAGAPILAVRMQELFGLADTPRIAGGRVPVVLHLLAPNHRPQQVTQDLKSFWNSVYPKIRGELRARYPRHSWPEDPRNAAPVRGVKPRHAGPDRGVKRRRAG